MSIIELDNKEGEVDYASQPSKARPVPINHTDIDFDYLQSLGYLASEHDDAIFSLEFRYLKRSLLLALQKSSALNPLKTNNMVLITSSMEKEGKTFMSLNLALSMASALEKKILLIDGDLIKSGLTKAFGLMDKPGFADLILHEDADCFRHVQQTQVKGLEILTSGQVSLPFHAIDALYSGERIKRCLNVLAESYRDSIIILDTPPLLQTTASSMLSSYADLILLVVASGQTTVEDMDASMRMLNHCSNVNVVLNQLDNMFQKQARYYAYHASE